MHFKYKGTKVHKICSRSQISMLPLGFECFFLTPKFTFILLGLDHSCYCVVSGCFQGLGYFKKERFVPKSFFKTGENQEDSGKLNLYV